MGKKHPINKSVRGIKHANGQLGISRKDTRESLKLPSAIGQIPLGVHKLGDQFMPRHACEGGTEGIFFFSSSNS